MITGTTSHKLDLVSTYDDVTPFVVGVNGVTNIEYINTTGYSKIFYTIGDIEYSTTLNNNGSKKNSNLPVNANLTQPTTFKTNLSGYGEFKDVKYPTIKEDTRMNLVFEPKINSEIFIERPTLAVFEKHSRLSDIRTLDDFSDYRNGSYYNIIINS
jgi:hypothetical protein